MSEMNLSEFLMANRPQVEDLYIFFKALINLLSKEPCCDRVVFHPEYVFYDREKKKVLFKKNSNLKNVINYDVLMLMNFICDSCRYSDDETVEFAKGFVKIYKEFYKKENGLKKCGEYLKKYNKNNDMIYSFLLFFVAMAIESIIVLSY